MAASRREAVRLDRAYERQAKRQRAWGEWSHLAQANAGPGAAGRASLSRASSASYPNLWHGYGGVSRDPLAGIGLVPAWLLYGPRGPSRYVAAGVVSE